MLTFLLWKYVSTDGRDVFFTICRWYVHESLDISFSSGIVQLATFDYTIKSH